MGPNEILFAKFLSNLSIGINFKSTYASLPIKRYGVNLLNEKYINFLKSNNQKVIAWTINDESEMRLLIKRGVDGIMTDNIRLLKNILIEENKWK
jgi:glycerophosphoryl diester phosphodiesterase